VSPFIINGDAPLYVCLPLPIIGDTLNQMCLALGSLDPKSLCNRVLFRFSSNRWSYFLLRQPSFTVLTTAPQAFLDPSAPQELLDPFAPQAHIAAAKAHTAAVVHPLLVVSHTAAARAAGEAASPTSHAVNTSLPPS
jgi:hypothetical protein